jgi:hypothetical protein
VTSSGVGADLPSGSRNSTAEFVSQLEGMNEALVGVAELRTHYEEKFVKLDGSPRGRVTVSCAATESAECTQQIRICFATDQAVLRPLIDDLCALLRA